MRVSVFRKEQFNAAHRLHNPAWTDEKNRQFYGQCNNPNFHGHNYELVVKVTGEVDSDTGYLIDMGKLSSLIKSEVLDVFDHKNLNLDIEEFKHLIPSTENFAALIWHKLRPKIDKSKDLSVILYETERNFVEYSGS